MSGTGVDRAPSVVDVAKQAGVSVGTVSNVFNHPDRVAPSTYERVIQAVHDLRYVPNQSARELRLGGRSIRKQAS